MVNLEKILHRFEVGGYEEFCELYYKYWLHRWVLILYFYLILPLPINTRLKFCKPTFILNENVLWWVWDWRSVEVWELKNTLFVLNDCRWSLFFVIISFFRGNFCVVLWKKFNNVGDSISFMEENRQYCWGCSVVWRDTTITYMILMVSPTLLISSPTVLIISPIILGTPHSIDGFLAQ